MGSATFGAFPEGRKSAALWKVRTRAAKTCRLRAFRPRSRGECAKVGGQVAVFFSSGCCRCKKGGNRTSMSSYSEDVPSHSSESALSWLSAVYHSWVALGLRNNGAEVR